MSTDSGDAEIEAMRVCGEALAPLDPAARGRVLGWMLAKLGADGGVDMGALVRVAGMPTRWPESCGVRRLNQRR
jgi:hypothetical protein